ncbi:hypothetical protein RIU76_06330 [Latilactobacillus sakei subsp. sakei]|uniref:hypothetical protein n=1 Tax=Latilactobacillus sakei TaxID=1599 RepID=UPI0028663366|nr:hypothetical protein [Latilactobacillus sakei]MDR7924341.1 hypothetical protein [Latilactobacillus sakei subsp. sakei]
MVNNNSSKSVPNFIITNILSPKEVIISGGSLNDVYIGDYFNILSDTNDAIINPNTGEVLGSIKRYKYRLVVKKVFPKYSILSTISHSSIKQRASDIYLKKSISSINEYQEEMRVSKNEVNNIFSEYSHETVHIGDSVMLVKS